MERARRAPRSSFALPELGMEPHLVESLRRRSLIAHPRFSASWPADRNRPLLPTPARLANPWTVDGPAAGVGRQWSRQRADGAVGTPLPELRPDGVTRGAWRVAAHPSLEHRSHPWVQRAGANARLDPPPHRLSRQGRDL